MCRVIEAGVTAGQQPCEETGEHVVGQQIRLRGAEPEVQERPRVLAIKGVVLPPRLLKKQPCDSVPCVTKLLSGMGRLYHVRRMILRRSTVALPRVRLRGICDTGQPR